MEARLFGHLLGCPYCQTRFYMPDPARNVRQSGWQGLLSFLLAPLVAISRMLWPVLPSTPPGRQDSGRAMRSSRYSSRSADYNKEREEDDLFLYYDDDEDLDDELDDDVSGESPSRERRYYDSSGRFVGYRDESGWFHGEGGRNYMGYMEDDGSFYDGSGAYRGQVEDGGLLWEEGKGYTGFHESNHFSEEGHYGVPDVYEEGGDGTGGAFNSMIDDDDD